MFLLIRRGTTVSRCKSHFPTLAALFTGRCSRERRWREGARPRAPALPTLAPGPAPSGLPPAPTPPSACTAVPVTLKKKKSKGILCTMGQTRLENYLQILKESSHIYSRVFTELCLTKNCPSRCHREITMHHHCQKESSWSPLWLHHNVGKTHKRNDTPIHEVYDRQRTD